MIDEFDICGTHIPLNTIKDYRIIQREYIYRPAYGEKESSFRKFISTQKYEFREMVPFAAILKDDEYKLAVKKAKAKTIGESILKDVAVGVTSTLASKFNIKELKYKKYHCKNAAERTFDIYLEDVPAVVIRNDGKISDIHKDDELYVHLGEPIAPTILMVPALAIYASEDYIFYGNGIQLQNVEDAYTVLHGMMREYKESLELLESNEKRRLGFLPGLTTKMLSSVKHRQLTIPEKTETAKTDVVQEDE